MCKFDTADVPAVWRDHIIDVYVFGGLLALLVFTAAGDYFKFLRVGGPLLAPCLYIAGLVVVDIVGSHEDPTTEPGRWIRNKIRKNK